MIQDAPVKAGLPPALLAYIWRTTGHHQIALTALSAAVFLLTTAPLELQRRIVNGALGKQPIEAIVLLCLGYAGLALALGLLKLAWNVYRNWIGERAVRDLRLTVHEHDLRRQAETGLDRAQRGTDLAVILAEVEPVGSFVGASVSEPVLQIGILLSVFGYMLFLQPGMAVLSFVILAPQLVVVPLIQRVINRRAASRILTVRDISAELIGELSDRPSAADRSHFRAWVDRVFALNLSIFWWKFSMNFLINLLYHFGVVGVLLLGGWLVARGDIEPGTIVAFISGLVRLTEPWSDLVNYFRDMAVARIKYDLIAAAVPPSTHRDEGIVNGR